MPNPADSADFYATIAPQQSFARLSDPDVYTPLTEDWWVGTSDIVGSTQAVADGKYKTVNMVGAAVISAQINAHEGAPFPFIFGGDGAGFAVPPAWKERAAEALAAVQAWAQDEFEMGLRIGMTRAADIAAAGMTVKVARFQVAEGVDYAMFSGGGISWAENQMKAGAATIPPAPSGTQPDLTGLSCRWSNMPSRHGTILSVVIMPCEDIPGPAFSKLARNVVEVANGLTRAGHPVYHDGIRLDGDLTALLARPAIAAGAGALATVVLAAADAQTHLTAVRALLPDTAGASLLAPDVLVARLLAPDSFALRQSLIPVLMHLNGGKLPLSWRL